MGSIYNEEELEQLEQSEHEITEKALVVLFAAITSSQQEMERELRLFYEKYGKDGVVTYAEARKWISERDHQRRLSWLILLLGAMFSDLFGKLRPTFNTMILDIIAKEYDFFGVSLDAPKLNWGTDKLTWLDRLADDVTAWEAFIINDIKRSMLMKKNINEVVKLLDERFLTIKNVVKSLGVTETTAIGSITRRRVFKELGISKYKYYAREDERTCEQCGALHGLIFPVSAYEPGVTASPLHPRCRCWEVPIRE